VPSATMRSVYDPALRIMGHLGRQAMISTCSCPLKALARAILSFPFIRRCERAIHIVGLARWEA
jgi:hypothetical protein